MIQNEEMSKLAITLLMDFCEDKGNSEASISMSKKTIPHLLNLLRQLVEIVTGKVNLEFVDTKLVENDKIEYLQHYLPKNVLREQRNVIVHALKRLLSLKVNESVLPECCISSSIEGKKPGIIWRIFPLLCVAVNTKDDDIRILIQRLLVKASQEVGLY